MKHTLKPAVAGLASSLVLIFLVFTVEYLEKQRFIEAQRSDTTRHLSQIRANIEAEINADFYLTRGLIAFVESHPDLKHDTFRRIASKLLRQRSSIRNIGLAPDNILTFVYPLVGNSNALGLNYRENKAQWPSVKRVLDMKQTVVAGPVNLVQGGTAFISRTPIYIQPNVPGENTTYWGLASIVIDDKKLFKAASLHQYTDKIELTIRGKDGLGKDGELISGSIHVITEDPIAMDVRLPAGSWQLTAVPKGGWSLDSPYLIWIRFAGVTVSLLFGGGIFIWLNSLIQKQLKINTARQNSEKAQRILENKEILLKAILENIPSILFVKKADDLSFKHLNKAGESFAGYPVNELIGKNDYDIFAEKQADCFVKSDRAVLASGKAITLQKETVDTKSKGKRTLQIRKIPLLGIENDPEYLLIICEDITDKLHAEDDKIALEKQLNQSKRLESIGLMAGGVAHDLNNILSGITGYPELMLRRLTKDSELRKPLLAIQEAGERSAAIVADLLTVARGVASVKVVHNLNSMVLEYFNSPEYQKINTLYPKVTIQHKLDARRASLLCSSVHIKKCIMNLVNNAAESINDTGKVLVSTSNITIKEQKEIHQQRLTVGDYLMLNVQDTGQGVSPEDLEHIFEPFFSKKTLGRSGTGLGLTVVWNTVEDHKGIIFAENSDEGVSFTLYFPVSKTKETIGGEEKEDLAGYGRRVLIVDDEEMPRDIARKMLEYHGYVVSTVNSGEDAIAFVKQTPVDLIMLDMLMDPGLNGYQTYAEIIKFYPSQKALIASGFSESNDVRAALALGASGFLKKPYSIDELGKAVKDALYAITI